MVVHTLRYACNINTTKSNMPKFQNTYNFEIYKIEQYNIRPLFGLKAEKIQGGPLVGEKAKQIQGRGQIGPGLGEKAKQNTRSGFRAGVKAPGPKTQLKTIVI